MVEFVYNLGAENVGQMVLSIINLIRGAYNSENILL